MRLTRLPEQIRTRTQARSRFNLMAPLLKLMAGHSPFASLRVRVPEGHVAASLRCPYGPSLQATSNGSRGF